MSLENMQITNSIASVKLGTEITSRCIRYLQSKDDKSIFLVSGSDKSNIYLFQCEFSSNASQLTSKMIFNYNEYLAKCSDRLIVLNNIVSLYVNVQESENISIYLQAYNFNNNTYDFFALDYDTPKSEIYRFTKIASSTIQSR